MKKEVRTICYDSGLKLEAYTLEGIVQPFSNHFHEYYVIGYKIRRRAAEKVRGTFSGPPSYDAGSASGERRRPAPQHQLTRSVYPSGSDASKRRETLSMAFFRLSSRSPFARAFFSIAAFWSA